MNKIQVQKRVLHLGEMISLDNFSWDEDTNIFSSKLDDLVIDFNKISYCTFNTGYNCTFKTGSYCTFKTGYDCVIVRRDIFEVIISQNDSIKLLPYGQKGYIIKKENESFYHFPNESDRIEIIDNIVSKVIQEKGNVLKVINNGKTTESYIVSNGENFAHGTTIKEAKESLIYKISNRDTSEYNNLTVNSMIL
jgi:hypothetical protein